MDRNHRERIMRMFLVALLTVSLAALAACGGGGGGGGGGPTPPTAFSLVSPPNASVNVVTTPQLNLTWADSSGETGYTVQIDTDPSFSSPLQYTGLAANTTSYDVTAALQVNTKYYWRVIAVNAQGSTTATYFAFTTKNPVPDPFSLDLPANNSTDVAVNPHLTWADSTGETSYTIEITAYAGGTLLSAGLAANTTSFDVPAGVLRIATPYYWRVIATNSFGDTTAGPSAFTTKNAAPDPFSLVTPADGTQDVSLMPDLVWTDAIGASLYTVETSTDATFASSVTSFTTTPTTTHGAVPSALQEFTTYYWRVLASNLTGAIYASNAPFSFKTKAVNAPGTFHLVSPADGTSNTLLRPDLTWTAASVVDTYTVEIARDSGFTTGLLTYAGISGSTTTFPVPSDLAETTKYYWHVLASNPSGTASSVETWSFTTKRTSSPSAFDLTSPTDGAAGVTLPVTLEWNDAVGEDSYTLQISTDNFVHTMLTATLPANSTSYTLSHDVLEGGVTYYWQVIAANANGQTVASNAPFSFTTRSGTTVWSQASNPSSIDDEPYGMTLISGGSLYAVGYDSNTAPGDDQWRIENRSLTDGSLVATFGTTTFGVVETNPSGSTIFSLDDANAVAVDASAMYVVGFDSIAGDNDWSWHIEKRDLVTGAPVTSFGSGGVISENNIVGDDEEALAVAVDPGPSGNLYIVGWVWPASQNKEWRIEARDKSNGNLLSSVTSNISVYEDVAYDIAIDPAEGYMYVVGSDQSSGDLKWRIEKRTLSAPLSLETTTFGGGTGYVLSNPGAGIDKPQAIALDAQFIYIAGYEFDTVNLRDRWRIEKRYRSDGTLETVSFGSGGVVNSNTTTGAEAFAIIIDSNYLYVAGYDNTSSGSLEWRIEKRSLVTGALVPTFGTGGVVVNDFGSPAVYYDDVAYAISVDANYLYVAGYESVDATNSRWRIMKLVK